MSDTEKAIGILKNKLKISTEGLTVEEFNNYQKALNTAISALEKQVKSNDDYKQLRKRIEDTIKHYEEQIEEIKELGPSQQLIGICNGYEQIIEDLKTDIELGELRV